MMMDMCGCYTYIFLLTIFHTPKSIYFGANNKIFWAIINIFYLIITFYAKILTQYLFTQIKFVPLPCLSINYNYKQKQNNETRYSS